MAGGDFLPPVVTRLEGDLDGLIAKVAEAKALIKSIGATSIEVKVSVTGISGPVAGAIAQIEALKAAMAGLDSKFVTVGVAGAGGGRGGRRGWWGWLNNPINLFGGKDNTPAFLQFLPAWITGMAAWHVALDGVAEALAVVIPSVIALGIFGLAAAGPIGDLKTQLTNMNIVANATGQSVGPLRGQLGQLGDSVKPYVYSIFGEALSLVNTKLGVMQQMADGAGQVLSQLAARAELALSSGGFSKFLANSMTDLSALGDIFGNIFGVIGNILKTLPGYAQGLLRALQDITGGLEAITSNSVVQNLTGMGFAFHGAVLWGGLLAGVLGKGISGGLSLVARGAGAAAVKLEGMGVMGGKAATIVDSLAGGAGVAATTLPWGWIAAGVLLVGFLVDKLITAKDATQQWIGSLQQGINSSSAGSSGSIFSAQVQETQALAAAQKQLAASSAAVGDNMVIGSHATNAQVDALGHAATAVSDLQQAQQTLSGESQLYNQRIQGMAGTYGSVRAAQGMLVASGVKLGAFLSTNKTTWAQVQEEVYATSIAYKQMGQVGPVLGADMAVLNYLAGDQYTNMTKLNQAWTTFIGLSTGMETGFNGLITGMRSLNTEDKNVHASFTGINASSITLQDTFEQQVSGMQGVIGSMRTAKASSHDMASVLSTILDPAVDKGALKNQGFRNQIYLLARQAGYTGPDALGPLSRWIDHNTTSLSKAKAEADKYSGALAHIPPVVKTTVIVNFVQTGMNSIYGDIASATAGAAAVARQAAAATKHHASGTQSAAPGWAMVGENGPELVRMSGGERVYPNGQGPGGGGGMTEVHVYLDSKEIFAKTKSRTYDYNAANGNRSRGGRVRGVLVPR